MRRQKLTEKRLTPNVGGNAFFYKEDQGRGPARQTIDRGKTKEEHALHCFVCHAPRTQQSIRRAVHAPRTDGLRRLSANEGQQRAGRTGSSAPPALHLRPAWRCSCSCSRARRSRAHNANCAGELAGPRGGGVTGSREDEVAGGTGARGPGPFILGYI
jgi:hypothetical protein